MANPRITRRLALALILLVAAYCDFYPPASNILRHIIVTLDHESAYMLDKLVSRHYPDKGTSQARAEIIEQGIRTIYRRTFGHKSPIA